jgi:beta-galactosidase
MKNTFVFGCLFFLFTGMPAQQQPGQKILFDDNWRFHRGGAQGAENPGFDDTAWIVVDLPHDWSIEDIPGTYSPFSRDAISQVIGGFTTGGTGWYRKTFFVPADMQDKKIFIQFEGVYMNSEVWLNGKYVGQHPYGYTTFSFDLTTLVMCGENNVLAVKVMNEGENSRWYSGSGIYRHVWLITKNRAYISAGSFVTTPEITESLALVRVRTEVANETSGKIRARLNTRITDPEGNMVNEISSEQVLMPDEKFTFLNGHEVVKPRLWSTEDPVMYKVVTELYTHEGIADVAEYNLGIRQISFDTENGFRLNGKVTKLKGGCVHHDNGPLGAKAFDRAEERRVELLKANGFNAIRCAHNPPSPAFLTACDRLGMLVIDEAFDMWNQGKNPYDYHLYFDEWWQKDIEAMVLRDLNHPSVIMWSIGNEIPGRHKPEVVTLARKLADYVRELDPTRPVTSAVNELRPDKDPYFGTLDLAGYNYAAGGDHMQQSLYEQDQKRVPGRIMYGSESYPLEAFQSWMEVIDHPYVIGDFVWTSFDYVGEASIGWRGYWQEQDFYPWNLAFCGDLDICGWKRPQSFYRDALWKENQLSVFVRPPEPSFPLNPKRQFWSKWHWHDVRDSWNWEGYEGEPMEISVYSSCERVELLLNGKSFGIKPVGRGTQFTATWEVPYTPGTVRAVGYTREKAISERELKTAGKPEQLELSADRDVLAADGQDLCYVTVEVTDEKGLRNPNAENLIEFSIEGPGTVVAVGNANPVSIESYTIPQRKTWQGRCLVIVRAGKEEGTILLSARSEGLESDDILITVGNKQ